jgi:hypothetical protein
MFVGGSGFVAPVEFIGSFIFAFGNNCEKTRSDHGPVARTIVLQQTIRVMFPASCNLKLEKRRADLFTTTAYVT